MLVKTVLLLLLAHISRAMNYLIFTRLVQKVLNNFNNTYEMYPLLSHIELTKSLPVQKYF